MGSGGEASLGVLGDANPVIRHQSRNFVFCSPDPRISAQLSALIEEASKFTLSLSQAPAQRPWQDWEDGNGVIPTFPVATGATGRGQSLLLSASLTCRAGKGNKSSTACALQAQIKVENQVQAFVSPVFLTLSPSGEIFAAGPRPWQGGGSDLPGSAAIPKRQ